jgi:hypothetical protein
MTYPKSAWEEVSFQVFEDEGGSIRSGYYPTGNPATGDVAVDFTFGNFPIQPNELRNQSGLSVMDSHTVAATEWNNYPNVGSNLTVGSSNYMITGFKLVGGITYECTSQNNLQKGYSVTITGIPYLNGPGFPYSATVTYADVNRFQFEAEIGDPGVLTGLYGRVEVYSDQYGKTLENGNTFYYPALGWCNDVVGELAQVKNYFNYLAELGVDKTFLKDFTFSGGENEWDASADQPNWDGCVFYYYFPAEYVWGEDWLGQPIYGSDVEGEIIYGSWPTGYELDITGTNPEDYAVIVVSNDPRKNNFAWWGF